MGCIQSCLKGKQEDVTESRGEVRDSGMGQTASRAASRVQEYLLPQNETEGTKPLLSSSTASDTTEKSAPSVRSVQSIHSTDSGSFPLGVETATPRRPLSSVRTITPIEATDVPTEKIQLAQKRSHDLYEGDLANQIEAIIPSKKAKEHVLYLDYPFLDDETTIEYIKNSKIMFIMKGISGSGKSTVARNLRDTFSHSYHSADDFFNKTGEYIFDFTQLKEAHQSCQLGAIEAAERHQNVIIIDNTNVRNWEMKIYLTLAKEYNYIVAVVEPKTPWAKNAEELAMKNTHGVNEEIIYKKVKMYQDPCPLYYGWFLNEKDSAVIIELANAWLKTALEELPYFFRDFSAQSGKTTKEDILSYFSRQHFPNANDIIHCTSKFTARGSQPNAKDYMRSPKVVSSLGKYFEVNIIGFVITPRTLGARIQLTSEQIELWEQNDDEEPPVYERIYPQNFQTQENAQIENVQINEISSNNEQEAITKDSKINESSKDSTTEIQPDIEKLDSTQNKGGNKENKGKKGNKGGGGGGNKGNKQNNNNENNDEITIPPYNVEKREFYCKSTKKMVDQDLGPNRFHPTFGIGSRAHFTIGCADNVKPVTTGLDLIDAINAEQKFLSQIQENENGLDQEFEDAHMTEPSENSLSVVESFKITGAILRQYESGTWVVYPDKKIVLGSIFSGDY